MLFLILLTALCGLCIALVDKKQQKKNYEREILIKEIRRKELEEARRKQRKEEQKRIEREKYYEETCIIRNEIIDELIKDEYVTVKETIAKCEAKHNRKIDKMHVEDEIDYQNFMASQFKGYDRIRMDKRGKQRPKNLHEEIMELRKDIQRITKELNESIENHKKIEEEKKVKGIGIHRDYENMSDYDYYRSYFESTYGIKMTGTYPGEASKELQNEIRTIDNVINNCIKAEKTLSDIEDIEF